MAGNSYIRRLAFFFLGGGGGFKDSYVRGLVFLRLGVSFLTFGGYVILTFGG